MPALRVPLKSRTDSRTAEHREDKAGIEPVIGTTEHVAA